jgi:dienelactone hydrolase
VENVVPITLNQPSNSLAPDEDFFGTKVFFGRPQARLRLRHRKVAARRGSRLTDIDAAIAALRRRPDVAPTPVLLGGQSRGGVLAVAYGGLHPAQIFGVINFVGGWLGKGCSTASAVNQAVFERGAHYRRPTIWLYGRGDPFYSIAHSRSNFAAFEKAGGQGSFFEFGAPSNPGHFVFRDPDLWSGAAGKYLDSLGNADQH